jgi:hypothetical protein
MVDASVIKHAFHGCLRWELEFGPSHIQQEIYSWPPSTNP